MASLIFNDFRNSNVDGAGKYHLSACHDERQAELHTSGERRVAVCSRGACLLLVCVGMVCGADSPACSSCRKRPTKTEAIFNFLSEKDVRYL